MSLIEELKNEMQSNGLVCNKPIIFNNKFIQDLCVKYKRLGKQISFNENQINLNKNEYME